jgi:hypothetical protein
LENVPGRFLQSGQREFNIDQPDIAKQFDRPIMGIFLHKHKGNI